MNRFPIQDASKMRLNDPPGLQFKLMHCSTHFGSYLKPSLHSTWHSKAPGPLMQICPGKQTARPPDLHSSMSTRKILEYTQWTEMSVNPADAVTYINQRRKKLRCREILRIIILMRHTEVLERTIITFCHIHTT